MNPARERLLTDGYCTFESLLDQCQLEQVRRVSDAALQRVSSAHRKENKSQGSLINISDHPGYADLIGNASAREVFRSLGFANPCFSSGYLISKPPGGPALFWHQDWWGWDDPLSYSDQIAQVFFMYYLTDTTPQNGCLRILPGSHRRRHSLHEAI